MSRLAVSLVVLLCSGGAWAQACKPSYEVVHQACKPGAVTRWSTVPKVEVVEGACKEPDGGWAAACHDKEGGLSRAYPGARIEYQTHTTRGLSEFERCDGGKRRKVDVICSFKLEVPEFKMDADAGCPIIDVVENGNCFKTDSIAISSEDVKTCLDLNPTRNEIEKWWIKAACLSDLNKAAMSQLKVPYMSKDDVAELNDQLPKVIDLVKRLRYDQLVSYLAARQHADAPANR